MWNIVKIEERDAVGLPIVNSVCCASEMCLMVACCFFGGVYGGCLRRWDSVKIMEHYKNSDTVGKVAQNPQC
jgi:hypothetical protein